MSFPLLSLYSQPLSSEDPSRIYRVSHVGLPVLASAAQLCACVTLNDYYDARLPDTFSRDQSSHVHHARNETRNAQLTCSLFPSTLHFCLLALRTIWMGVILAHVKRLHLFLCQIASM